MRRSSGFTLLEILLVLVLISLASVAVISTLPANAKDSAKKQAQALYFRVQLLNEEAMLSGNDFGLSLDESKAHYRFVQLKSDGWHKLEQDDLATETELEDNLAMRFELGGTVWNDKQRLFKPGSLFEENSFSEQEQKTLPPPQVFIMSSGEITPFSIAIYPRHRSAEKDAWQIVAKENGQILLLAPGESDEQS